MEALEAERVREMTAAAEARVQAAQEHEQQMVAQFARRVGDAEGECEARLASLQALTGEEAERSKADADAEVERMVADMASLRAETAGRLVDIEAREEVQLVLELLCAGVQIEADKDAALAEAAARFQAMEKTQEDRIAAAAAEAEKVRKTPSWPRSWTNCSPLQLCSHRNAWANLHLLGQPGAFLARSP